MKFLINFLYFNQLISTFNFLNVSFVFLLCIINCFLQIESLQNCNVRTDAYNTRLVDLVSNSWQSSSWYDYCFHLNKEQNISKIPDNQGNLFMVSDDTPDDQGYQWIMFEFKQHIQLDAVEVMARISTQGHKFEYDKERDNKVEIWTSPVKVAVDNLSEHCNATFMKKFNKKRWTQCGTTNFVSTTNYTVKCLKTASFTKTLLFRKFIQHENLSNKQLHISITKLQGLINSSFVMVQRVDSSVTFDKNWAEYEQGFGDPYDNFWCGLENIYQMTKNNTLKIRFEMKKFNDDILYWSEYKFFKIDGPDLNYRLHIGEYNLNSTAGDAMFDTYPNFTLNGMAFTTQDRDNDLWKESSCSKNIGNAGWWFNHCGYNNPNGIYYNKSKFTDKTDEHGYGINWHRLDEWNSLKYFRIILLDENFVYKPPKDTHNPTAQERLNQANTSLDKLKLFNDDSFADNINAAEAAELLNSTLTQLVSDLRNKSKSEIQTGVKNAIDGIAKLDSREKYTNTTSTATVLLESVGKVGSLLYQTDESDITILSSNETILIKAGQMTTGSGTGSDYKQFVAEDKVTLIKVNTPAGATNASLVFTTINMTNIMSTLFSNLTDPTAKLESNLIQATIYNRGNGKKISSGSTSTKIIMRLPFTASNDHHFAKRKCVFFADENPQNFESGKGCRAVPELSTSLETVCECDHLTGFAVLMYPNEKWSDLEFIELLKNHQLSLNIVTYVCLGISILCLLMTNVTYFVVKLKFQIQDKTIMNMHRVHHSLCFMLMVAHILYLTGLERTENFYVCNVMSGLIFYFYLSVFFWVLCEGLMYTKSLIIVIPKMDSVIANIRFVHYCIIGYLGPLVVLVITISIRHEHLIRKKSVEKNDTFSTAQVSCWLSSEKGTIWAFMGPVFLICLFNLVVFSSIIVKLSRSNSTLTQVKDENKDFTDFLKRQLEISFKLAIILGLTWFIGLFFALPISYPTAHLAMLYAFAISNGLQGAFIFFTQVLLHHRIRDGWAEFLLKHKRCLPGPLLAYLEQRRRRKLDGSSSNSNKHKKSSDQHSGSGRLPTFINFIRRQFSSGSQHTKTSELLPDSHQLEQLESNNRLLSEHEHQETFSDTSDNHCMEPVVLRSYSSNPKPPPLTTLPNSLASSNDRLNIA